MGYEEIIEDIKFKAKVYGWEQLPHSTIDLSFVRKGVRVNIWFNKFDKITVGTALDHPKQGKTQLFRKNVSLHTLERILENPRAHTGRGYHFR